MSAGGILAQWDRRDMYSYAIGSTLAQTFTVPAGYDRIDQVDIPLRRIAGSGTITVSIVGTTNGVPSGSALASATLASSAISAAGNNYYTFQFTPLVVTAGTTYAITFFVSGGCQIGWWRSTNPDYSGGQGYLNGGNWNRDFGFKVYGYTATSKPVVLTGVSSLITQTSFTMAGEVTSNGGASLSARGFVYSVKSTNANPVIGGTGVTTVAEGGTSVSAFTKNITGLTSSVTYAVRAYATNANGTSYGTVVDVLTAGTNRIFMYASQAFTTHASNTAPISGFSIKMSDGNPYYASHLGDSQDYVRKWWIVSDNGGVPGGTVLGSGLFSPMTCTQGSVVSVTGISIPISTNTKYHLVLLIDMDDNTTSGTQDRAHWDFSLLDKYASHSANHSAEFLESASEPGMNFSTITWCNPGAATSISNANPAVVTRTAHRFATGDEVSFTTTGTLPTGLSTGTTYYVIWATADTFNLATSYNNAIAGTKIATTGAGSGTHTIVIDRDYEISVTQSTALPAYSLYRVSDVADGTLPTISAVDSTNGLEARFLTSGNGRLIFAGSSLFPRRVFYSELGTDTFLYKKVTGHSSIGTYPTLNIKESVLTSDMVGWDVYNYTKDQTATIETIVDADTMTISRPELTHAWAHDDVIYICSNYIDLDNKATGLCSLGDQNPFLVFTESSCYLFDPNSLNSRILGNYGCSSHRSIKVISGTAIWINKEGMYRFSTGMSEPVKISLPLENNVTFRSIWNGINPNNFSKAAAFIYKNKYYVSVGDNSYIVTSNTNIEDCIIVYNLDQQSFTVESYGASGLGSVFATFDDAVNGRMVIGGSRDNMTLYRMYNKDKFTDDMSDGSVQEYTFRFRTKEVEEGQIELDKIIKEAYIKLFAQNPVTISYIKDGDMEYNYWTRTFVTPEGKQFHREMITAFADANMKSISIQFEGTGAFILFTVGIYLKEGASSNLRTI